MKIGAGQGAKNVTMGAMTSRATVRPIIAAYWAACCSSVNDKFVLCALLDASSSNILNVRCNLTGLNALRGRVR